MSDEQSTCPHCGKPASQKLLGMCPQCMLKAGLGGFTAEGSIPEQAASRFIPPTVEELGRYFPQLEILELIGRGGMGAVYKARQKQLDRLVALKILPPGIGGGNAEGRTQNVQNAPDADATAFAQRFTREAKALAALAHPNIVTLYEFGQAFPGARTSSSAPSDPPDAENQADAPLPPIFFFLMEFVDGMNLRQLLAGGRLAPQEALAIVPHICDALQYAHDRGIVHRDIKPENILLGRDGVVKIADFGVAKIIGQVPPVPSPAEFRTSEPASDAPATTSEKVMGTPAYMAPEQLDRPAEVDHRADIYSLGVVLYQMLTGELPGRQIEPPSRKVQIDVRIDEIVMRALDRNPDMRYSQASVFKTEVETVASTSGSPLQPFPLDTRAETKRPDERYVGASVQRFHLRKVEYLIPIIGMLMIGITSIAMMNIAHRLPGNQIANILALLKIASNVEAVVVWGGLAWCIVRWARYSGNRPPDPSSSGISGPQSVISAVSPLAASNAASHFSGTPIVGAAWVLAVVTLAVHTAVFLALVLFAAFVIPRFESIFKDFHTDLPLLTRMTMPLTHGVRGFWYLIPLFVAANAGICLLLGYLNARRSLIGWLICGTALLLVVGAAMFQSLFLPVQGLMQRSNSPPVGIPKSGFIERRSIPVSNPRQIPDGTAEVTPRAPSTSRPSIIPADVPVQPGQTAEFYMGGKVQRVGVYSLSATRPITLKQAIVSAGMNPGSDMSRYKVTLVRRYEKDGEYSTAINLAQLLSGVVPDRYLQANDLVNVEALPAPTTSPAILPADSPVMPGQTARYSVEGKGIRAGWFDLTGREITLKQALISAGLFPTGNLNGRSVVLVRHGGASKQSRTTVQIDDLFFGRVADRFLQANDLIIVQADPATQPATTQATTTPSNVPRELGPNSANGLTIDCRPSSGQYRVGEKVLIWCTLTNSTKQTKPVAYNTIGGSHFTLISGVEVFEKTSNNIQVLRGGLLPLAIPHIREPLTVRSGHPETEQILDLPPGKSIQFVLDCGPAEKPQNFTGRIVYDPAASHAAFVLRPDDLLAMSVSNVFTYRIAEQQAQPATMTASESVGTATKSAGQAAEPSADGKTTAEAARLKLQFAETRLKQVEALYRDGRSSGNEYGRAKFERDAAAAELKGDTAEVLRLKARFAKQNFELLDALFRVGRLDGKTFLRAKFDRDIAEAELKGDAAEAARLQQEFARQNFNRIQALYKAGAATTDEYEKAKLARDLADIGRPATLPVGK